MNNPMMSNPMMSNPMMSNPMMSNPMMSNPMMRLLGSVRQGGNPRQIIQRMAQSDPRAGQVMQILGGKSADQQRTVVENMAKERGIDLGQMAQSLGLRLPNKN